MATQGTATLDFGAFPGASDASVAVTGQATIGSGSLVEAWLFPATTADHTADEHWVETIQVRAGNVIAGTGFTIYGWNTNQVNEPVNGPVDGRSQVAAAPRGGPGVTSDTPPTFGGTGTRIYGTWNVAWVWN